MPKDRLLSVNRRAWCLLATISLLAGGAVHAQDAAAEKKAEPPRIAMCVPLAVPVSQTMKMVVRGWALASATEVRSSSPQVSFKVLSAASVAVPNGQDAKQIGDTQMELEVTVVDGVEPGEAILTVHSPTGESPPHRLLIGSVHPLVADIEPNDGFQEAQQIQVLQRGPGCAFAQIVEQPDQQDVASRVGDHVEFDPIGAVAPSWVEGVLVAVDRFPERRDLHEGFMRVAVAEHFPHAVPRCAMSQGADVQRHFDPHAGWERPNSGDELRRVGEARETQHLGYVLVDPVERVRGLEGDPEKAGFWGLPAFYHGTAAAGVPGERVDGDRSVGP